VLCHDIRNNPPSTIVWKYATLNWQLERQERLQCIKTAKGSPKQRAAGALKGILVPSKATVLFQASFYKIIY
jgi:hypothetical protein